MFYTEGSTSKQNYSWKRKSFRALGEWVRRGHGLCKKKKEEKKKIGRNSIVCHPEYNIDCFVIEKILMFLFPLHYYPFAR